MQYQILACREWRSRGFQDFCLPEYLAYWHDLGGFHGGPVTWPDWWGIHEIHWTHRVWLLLRKPDHYEQFGWTDIDVTGYVVSEVSPYELDLSWEDLTEPDEIRQVVRLLGRATAKVHCASDSDSDQDLVDFQVEEAVAASVGERREELVEWVVDFGKRYADRVRADHALFVEAFRSGRIGVAATG